LYNLKKSDFQKYFFLKIAVLELIFCLKEYFFLKWKPPILKIKQDNYLILKNILQEVT
jgi:hypothetical protein